MCLFYDNVCRCRSTILYHFPRNKFAYGFLKHVCQLWIRYYSRAKSRNVKGLDIQKKQVEYNYKHGSKSYLRLEVMI